MKKTQLIEVFANIKHTWVNFLSILMFVFLGIAVYIGLEWTGMDLKTTSEEHFCAGNYSDYEITFPYGASQDYLNQLSELSSVSEVEGIYSTYKLWPFENGTRQAHIISISDNIDCFSEVEGVLPQSGDEICLDKNIAEDTDLTIGDVVTFKEDDAIEEYTVSLLANGDADRVVDELSSLDGTTHDALRYNTYTITAIVENPRYMNESKATYGISTTNSMQADCVFYVSKDAFNTDNISGYGCVLVKCNKLSKLNSFSEEYKTESKLAQDEISKLADEIASERYNVITSTYEKVSESINESISETSSGISQGESKIASGKQSVAVAEETIAAKRAELEKTRQHLDSIKGWVPDSIYSKLYSEYTAGLSELASAEQQLNSGKSELNSARAQVNSAKSQLSSLREYYNQWLAKADLIEDYGAITSAHTTNGGYYYIEMLSNIIRKMKFSMGGLFLIISFLICYSVITRLVKDQEKQIGTKKALGLSQSEITLGYLLYTGIAVIIGSVLGIILARFFIEPTLIKTVCVTFSFECKGQYFAVSDVILIVVAELIIALAITLFACNTTLKNDPILLLRGDKQSSTHERFYERSKLWDKRSVLTKTIISNFTNDIPRIVSTLIGIAGCCALIVSSVTMRENVMDCFNKQHTEYAHFDKIIYYNNTVEGAADNIASILEENSIDYSAVYRTGCYVSNDDMSDTFMHLVVYDDSFKNVYDAYSVNNNNPMKYKGIWIPESIQKYYGISENDKINLKALDGTVQSVKLNGFYHYYSYHMMALMDKDTYTSMYGITPTNNAFLINSGQIISDDDSDEQSETIDYDQLEAKLNGVDGYLQTYYSYDSEEADAEVFKLIADVFVDVYLVISILMAIFVIMNLLIVFVEEKKSELIILMINGYSERDAHRYIYSDTIILGVIGIAIGIAIGFVAGDWSIRSFESEYLYVLHGPNLFAAIEGTIITGGLTAVMTIIALRKISKFRLADIKKE